MVPGATTKVMTLGDPYHIEPGQLWYFSYLCDACGPGPLPNLYRAYRDASGAIVMDDLKQRVAALGTVVAFAANWQRGLAWVAVCDGACGPVEGGGSIAGAAVTGYGSKDGGITWARIGSFPEQTNLVDGWSDEAVALRFAGAEAAAPFEVTLYPSGDTIRRPSRAPVNAYPVILNDFTLLWRAADGRYYDGAGTVLFGPLFAEKLPANIVVADHQYQHTYLTWSEQAASRGDPTAGGREAQARIRGRNVWPERGDARPGAQGPGHARNPTSHPTLQAPARAPNSPASLHPESFRSRK